MGSELKVWQFQWVEIRSSSQHEDAMASNLLENEHTSPTDISIEAVVELAEMQSKLREDAPALDKLFSVLKEPSRSFHDTSGVSMLADVRSYAMFRDSLNQVDPDVLRGHGYKEFVGVMEKYFETISAGVKRRDPEWIAIAKRFCSAINSGFLAKQMSDLYTRRERSDARYIGHESVP
jgi:hypothetical protein